MVRLSAVQPCTIFLSYVSGEVCFITSHDSIGGNVFTLCVCVCVCVGQNVLKTPIAATSTEVVVSTFPGVYMHVDRLVSESFETFEDGLDP